MLKVGIGGIVLPIITSTYIVDGAITAIELISLLSNIPIIIVKLIFND